MLPQENTNVAPADDFFVIMELTQEEKRELIAMWRLRNGQKSQI